VSRTRVVVTGSVAYDYLMTFPGRFLDVIVPDRMHRLSVSFLVDDMRRVRGGCGANIAYSLALLGAQPILMAAAGLDAADYRAWLEREGVDVTHLEIHHDIFTPSFFVSTDLDQNQIATFYAGAMARAGRLSVRRLDAASIAYLVIAPNDPDAMLQYAAECREHRVPYVYDPSQQVARLTAEDFFSCLDGAAILIGNEYEFGIIEKKTGLSEAEILARVPVVVVTRGPEGSNIALRGGTDEAPGGATTIRVPPAKLRGAALDPTGVGDAFRAGLLAARVAGLSWPVAGRVGSVAAVYALETVGPQPARYTITDFISRYQENYGRDGASGVERLARSR